MKRKPYIQFVTVNYPGKKLDEQKIAQSIETIVEATGITGRVYPSPIEHIKQMNTAVHEALADNVDAIVVYVPTFVWAGRFIQGLRKSTVPIVLWSECDAASFPLEGNALMHGSLGQVGIRSEIVYGNAHDTETIDTMKVLLTSAYAAKALSDSRFGVFGGVSMEINTGLVDPLQWMERFGIDTICIDQSEIIREGEKIKKQAITSCYNKLQKRFGAVVAHDERFDHAIRIYLGYKSVIDKYELDFASLKCIFDLSDHYASACLAQSLLNESGFVTACCGESNAALTMYMLRLMCDEPMMMADIAHVDKKEARLHLLCDGAASPSMATADSDVTLNYQNEVESAAGGVCVTLTGKPGPVTIAKLASYHGRFILHLAHGEAFVPNKQVKKECGFDTWPHVHVRLDGDPQKFIENNMGQYTVCCYGNQAGYIAALARRLNIELFRS